MSHDDKRDEVADAIRARQSLENDALPPDEDFSAQGLGSGLRFGAADDPLPDEDVALDDEDVELDREKD